MLQQLYILQKITIIQKNAILETIPQIQNNMRSPISLANKNMILLYEYMF